ncbi:5-methylcytosine-specific restriction endonuclease system specificity protein McrC [Bradyrhizobium sp. CSA112]|nr:5-methylcytosine-specific restriction endonuclease system specificity protein McrC [Bradyrhizobium sp. CSA112]
MVLSIVAIAEEPVRLAGRIPVRNLWLLLLYASDLGRYVGQFTGMVEESPNLPSLIGRLLAFAVERRLRRNLSRGYMRKEAILSRIRGRIDIRKTYARDLLSVGRVAVRFDDHTIDTPRNRFVRAALDAVAGRVSDADLSHRCRRLAGDLGRLGVPGVRPSRAAMSADRLGRNDAEDLLMITLARIVFDLVLPLENEGDHALVQLDRDEMIIWKLFEKAIGNFYAVELGAASGWRVQQGRRFQWQYKDASSGIDMVLPNMQTDIILENPSAGRRIVIDTKFTSIFSSTAYRDTVLKSGYLYQMYAYLRSQENIGDPLCDNAEGILLHPAIDVDVDEYITIQGHRIRFLTVNLARQSSEILALLRAVPALN